jgi:transcriptional regulator with XRE-family HTH domain
MHNDVGMQRTIPPEDLEFDLGDRIRRALRVSGVSVQEMAEYLEVGRSSVSNWTSGRVTPDGRTLRLIAQRTGVPLEWLRGTSTNVKRRIAS